MGSRLAEFARGLHMLDGIMATTGPVEQEGALEEARQEICTILLNQLGHDFAGCKPKTFLRRVRRRMQVTQLETTEG